MPRNKKEDRVVYRREKGRCLLCGSHHVDLPHHIIYKSHGGIDDRKNMVLLCRKCHTMVHSDEPRWREYLLDRMRGHYGMIELDDLKEKGKYKDFAYPN